MATTAYHELGCTPLVGWPGAVGIGIAVLAPRARTCISTCTCTGAACPHAIAGAGMRSAGGLVHLPGDRRGLGWGRRVHQDGISDLHLVQLQSNQNTLRSSALLASPSPLAST